MPEKPPVFILSLQIGGRILFSQYYPAKTNNGLEFSSSTARVYIGINRRLKAKRKYDWANLLLIVIAGKATLKKA